MARLAIFVDGGYIAKLGAAFDTWVDLEKLSAKIRDEIAGTTKFVPRHHPHPLHEHNGGPTHRSSPIRNNGRRRPLLDPRAILTRPNI